MKITYLVHSITVDNEAGIATGWLDSELSSEGQTKVRDRRSELRESQFDTVFCSDLKRARDTADLVFSDRVPIFLDWRLRECHYGAFDGQLARDFKTDREHCYIDTPYPAGESYRDIEGRMRSFLADAHVLFPAQRIAIVSHQAPQLALDVILNGQTWEHAIASDWRKTGAWQPGWEYEVVNIS